MEWPRNSGKIQEYPEVDKGEWFSLDIAQKKIFKGQREFLARLVNRLNVSTCSNYRLSPAEKSPATEEY